MYQGHFLNTAYWEYVPSILFIMAIFRGQGFLFYFLLAAYPFISHSIRKKAPLMLLPAERNFCPLSCLPPASHCSRNRHLPDALRKAGCRTSGHDPPRRAFLARHWLLFAASMSRVWLACRLHAGTTGRVCLLVSCGHVLPKPVASCSTFSLLLLGEVTIIFRRKDSVRSGAA